jgi:hypothetical protein
MVSWLKVRRLLLKGVSALAAKITKLKSWPSSKQTLEGTNVIAYLSGSSVMKKKGFVGFAPEVNVIKQFFFVAIDEAK